MAEFLHVPEVATGSDEVTLLEWLATEGDALASGTPVAVVETDKATVEIEVQSDATLLRRLAETGGQLAVGAPLAVLGAQGETAEDVDALVSQAGLDGSGREPEPEPEPETPAQSSTGSSAGSSADTQPERQVESRPEPGSDAPTGPAGSGRTFVSPIARRLLREAGVDPASVPGTGPNGRVVRRDVEAVLAKRERTDESPDRAEAAADSAPAGADSAQGGPAPAGIGAHHAVPHSKARRAVASRLAQSKQSIPHFYVSREVAVDDLLALRARLNEHSPVKLSVNDFVIRAVAVAHGEVSAANAVWTDDAVLQLEGVDVGVAIASERGLVTPCLRDVQSMSVSGVSAAVKAFAEQADSGRLQQRDLQGGTTCVSNLGMYGIDDFAAIINPPQSSILAVGAAQQRPIVKDGALEIATVMRLVLSVDHRVIDGSLAATWMASLAAAIENPLRLVV